PAPAADAARRDSTGGEAELVDRAAVERAGHEDGPGEPGRAPEAQVSGTVDREPGVGGEALTEEVGQEALHEPTAVELDPGGPGDRPVAGAELAPAGGRARAGRPPRRSPVEG